DVRRLKVLPRLGELPLKAGLVPVAAPAATDERARASRRRPRGMVQATSFPMRRDSPGTGSHWAIAFRNLADRPRGRGRFGVGLPPGLRQLRHRPEDAVLALALARRRLDLAPLNAAEAELGVGQGRGRVAHFRSGPRVLVRGRVAGKSARASLTIDLDRPPSADREHDPDPDRDQQADGGPAGAEALQDAQLPEGGADARDEDDVADQEQAGKPHDAPPGSDGERGEEDLLKS